MYKAFLIKYGEIGTKGKNRYIFEDMLVHQIRHALKKVDGTFDVTKRMEEYMLREQVNLMMRMLSMH